MEYTKTQPRIDWNIYVLIAAVIKEHVQTCTLCKGANPLSCRHLRKYIDTVFANQKFYFMIYAPTTKYKKAIM